MLRSLLRRWKSIVVIALTLTASYFGVAATANALSDCAKPAAYGLYASSYMDATLNPADAEDIEFLTRAGGVPNVMLVLDTSKAMIRLPGDGPAALDGAATYPPGVFGCGDDPVSAALPAVQAVRRRTYSSPCGDALSGTNSYGKAYNPSYLYDQEAKVCPWFTTGNGTNAGGFDPDFYFGSDGDKVSSANGAPNFFDKDMVFHDAAASDSVTWVSGTLGIPFNDGWSWNFVRPYQTNSTVTGNMKIATAEEFCRDLPTELMRTSCGQCMATRGFYFDGNILKDARQRQFPSIWYSGNYLNFFPPKFLIARKVMKDVLSVRREIRGAVARLNGSDGGKIVQQFNPACDQPDPSAFFNNRSTYVNAINAMTFEDRPVFAETLLDIGMYYHSTDLPWFGSGFDRRTPWASGQAPGSVSNNYSICYPCQTSSVILFSGGLPQADEDTALPRGAVGAADVNPDSGKYAGDVTTGILKNVNGTGGIPDSLCPECSTFTGDNDYKNNLPRVAWYLHNLDLRRNTEATKDCGSKRGSNLTNGGKQTLDVYTVGFGTSTAPDGNAILANTAQVGGGVFAAASDAAGLRTALEYILRTINERSTSFSVATVSRLQTQTGQSVIVPRFDPVKGAFWKGHLFRYDLYSEFVNGCEPHGTGDLDCDGTCTGVFLVDSDGKFIQEDASGKFMRNEPDVPACNQSQCGGCGIASNVPATPHWDAGEKTTLQGWRTRKLYTAIDVNNDGRVDATDGLTEFTDDATTAAALRPYMNVYGTQTCSLLASKLLTARDTVTADLINADLGTASPTYLTCVQTMIRYLRGADVFNEGKLVGTDWPKTNPNDLPDRQWKLGDIFHSSPVVVDPPLPSDGVLCSRGLHNQCIPSLWATAIKHDVAPAAAGGQARANAYDDYAKNARYSNRRKIVLVGANDGFIHAFNAGAWQEGDDPLTPGLDESLPPFNGHYDRGDGTELWAVMPPDQLAKAHLQLLSSTHQYSVDGTAMVRDVWVDGSVNGLGGTPAKDGKKQGREFHTVAVMSLRRGGTHYFALDVTDATRLASDSGGFAAPKFLWLYPQPDTRDLLEFGETYSDFLPTPPPIGPVRIQAGTGDSAYQEDLPLYTTAANASVRFNERWIAFLSGGFDPQYIRGRGVHMVDVWTGTEIFGFTKPLAGSGVAATDPRWKLNYPVAANVGMVMWGKSARFQSSFPPNEGYFDTATFGDVGGQLWVLRFNDPATFGIDGRADNWVGARAFQMDSGAGLCANQPFFYITANVALANTGIYRVLAGTGDRFNLLDRNGGTCGPDNIRACVQRGCSITLDRTRNRTAAKGIGDPQRGISSNACGTAPTFTDVEQTVSSCTVAGEVNVAIDCGNDGATSKSITTSCSGNLAGDYGCSSVVSSLGTPLERGTISNGNWFFSVTVFDTTGPRTLFNTPAEAIAYDTARLTAASLTQIDGASTTPPVADATGPGWAMSFSHEGTIPVGAVSYTANRLDERVSSPSAAANSCVFWNTTQRASSVASNDLLACIASKCTQEDRRLQHFYGADAATGALCLSQPSGGATLVRSIASATLVPPPAPQFTAFINQKGQVSFGLTSINTETGAQNRGVGGVTDAASLLEWIEIDRDLHACRHADGAVAPVCR